MRNLSEAAFLEGRDLLRKAGGQIEALSKFEEAVRIRPNFAQARLEAAKLHKYKGNYRVAIDYLDRALETLRAQGDALTDDEREVLAEVEKTLEKYREEFARDD